jgi:hypothetical protein
MVIRAVEFVRRWIARLIAAQRPKHGARDQQQGQRSAAGKNFSRKPRDPWALYAQTQGLRAITM